MSPLPSERSTGLPHPTSSVPSSDTGSERRARFLAAYDEQLRTDAETPSAQRILTLGRLRLAVFPGARGFITGPRPTAEEAAALPDLVQEATQMLLDQEVGKIEWKTRAHDGVPGLHEALLTAGYVPEESESIMIGEAAALAANAPELPAGVHLRRITEPDDVAALCACAGRAFGDAPEQDAAFVQALLARMDRERAEGVEHPMELWVAETELDGEDLPVGADPSMLSTTGRAVVCTGRLEPVPGTDFAGIWGGATLELWRGRGIYRALTAERARSALDAGTTLIHSDSTEDSRPILERYGFLKVSETTPYVLKRR